MPSRSAPSVSRPQSGISPHPLVEVDPSRALDDIDRRLIEMLRGDGRMSNRAMAVAVGLKEAAVATRLRSLKDRQLITVSTLVDWEQAGYSWDLWVYLNVEGRPISDVAREIARFDNVVWVHIIFGSADLIVHVLAVDRAHARRFLSEDLAGIMGVRNVRTSVTLDTLKFNVNFASLPLDATPPNMPRPCIELDQFDHDILKVLMEDGRRSLRQVAGHFDVSDSTIRLRVGRLEDAGLIRMCAQVDPRRTRLMRAWAFIGIDVADVDKRQVCEQLAKIPEVIVACLTAGTHDILVLAAAAWRHGLLDVVINQMRDVPGVYATSTSDIVEAVKLDYRWAKLAAVGSSEASSS